jgi:hypothetical protein
MLRRRRQIRVLTFRFLRADGLVAFNEDLMGLEFLTFENAVFKDDSGAPDIDFLTFEGEPFLSAPVFRFSFFAFLAALLTNLSKRSNVSSSIASTEPSLAMKSFSSCVSSTTSGKT